MTTSLINRHLGRCLAHNLLAVGALIALLFHGMADEARYQAEPYKPPAAGSPADLVERHDCWTGAAPADQVGKIPGRVVVVTAAGDVRYGGAGLVDKALEQVFEVVDHGLTVHGFCR